MIKKNYVNGRKTCRVTFEVPAAFKASQVSICGEFNNWNPDVHPLKKRKDGRFSTTISMKPGEYRFKYFLNEERWENDTEAEKNEPNEFGTHNSVIIV